MKFINQIIRLLLLTIALGCAAPSFAQTETRKADEAADAPAHSFAGLETVGFSLTRAHPLSLREAITLALAHNADIEIAGKNARLAQFDLQAAQGSCDPRLSVNSFFDRQKTPGTNIFNSASDQLAIINRTQSNSVQLEKLLPRQGARLSGEYSTARNVTNDPFNVFRSSHWTSLSFNLTQPLARGRSFAEARRQIEISKRNLSLTDQQFRARVIETVTAVQRAYWDLALALKQLQVRQQALAATRLQLAHVGRLIEQGRLAPMEVVAVEAQLARFEKELYSAVSSVSRAENALKELITADEQAELWQQTLLPVDDVNLSAPLMQLPAALSAALDQRPELQQQATAQALNEIQQRYWREQTKPQFDLTVSYSLNGFAGQPSSGTASPAGESFEPLLERLNLLSTGTGLPPLKPPPVAPPPRRLVGGYGQSLENLLLKRFNTLRVGLSLSLPLRNTTARAELGRALVEAEKLSAERRRMMQQIHVEVRNALQELRTAEAKLKAAEAARNAAAQALDSEQRRLDAGLATASVNLVLERQKQLTAAQGEELEARIEMNKTLAELQRVTGRTLLELGIDIQSSSDRPSSDRPAK